MFFQCTFHLKGADTVARADNHIVGTPHEPEVAILVLVGTISGYIPVTANTGLGRVWITPVFFKHPGRTLRLYFYRDIALFVRRKFAAVVIDHTHLETRRWLAHRAGLHFQGGETSTEQHCFGLAIAITDGHACCLFPHLDHCGVKRLTGSNTMA